jgi:hypothetical protein
MERSQEPNEQEADVSSNLSFLGILTNLQAICFVVTNLLPFWLHEKN